MKTKTAKRPTSPPASEKPAKAAPPQPMTDALAKLPERERVEGENDLA